MFGLDRGVKMDYVISFSPDEEKRLVAVAKQRGIAPEQLVKQLVLDQAPPSPDNWEAALDVKLRLLQECDGVQLSPAISARELFAQQEAKASRMTEDEWEAEEKLWEELEPILLAL